MEPEKFDELPEWPVFIRKTPVSAVIEAKVPTGQPDMDIEEVDLEQFQRDAAPQVGADSLELSRTLQLQTEQARLRNSMRKVPIEVLNRRHRKLRLLIEEGEYFSEEEVRQRAPLLYQLYVGRYKRYSPDADPQPGNELSKLLLERLSKSEAKTELDAALQDAPDMRDKLQNTETELTETQLSDNIDELLVLMHQRFLSGDDKEFFDYKLVDNEV